MHMYGGVQVKLDAFLTLALDEGEWFASSSSRLALKERTKVLTE
jgi:hypothetical protein